MENTLIRTLTLRIEQLEEEARKTRYSLNYWEQEQKEELEATIKSLKAGLEESDTFLYQSHEDQRELQEKLSSLEGFVTKYCCDDHCNKFNKCAKNKSITDKRREKGECLGCPLWVATLE